MEAKFENGLISPSQQEQHQQESQEEVKKSDEISKLKDENRSLRIKIAGVETLSSLLNGTRDELDTVLAEKESMEIEVATLQCRCSMLEKEIAEKLVDVKDSQSRASKEMFETVLRENKQLKNELKQAKISKHANEGLFDAESMFELLSFKNEVEMEIKNIQHVMKKEEGESQITQISRLLGQVSKLESQVKMKEEEIVVLKSELENVKQQLPMQSSEPTLQCPVLSENPPIESKNTTCVADIGVQTVSVREIIVDDATKGMNNKNATSESSRPKRSSSLRRRNSKRASGDWTNLKKSHSDIFEDTWCVDNINPSEQLKVTQDLLVQANEIIMIMTEENDKLLKVNAVLLEELSKEPSDDQFNETRSMKDRLKFLFSELSFDGTEDETEAIQDLLISTKIESLETSNSKDKDLCRALEMSCQLDPQTNNNNDVSEEPNKLQDTGLQDSNNKHTRDSGVDIFPIESDQHSSAPSSITKVVNKRKETTEETTNADFNDFPVDNISNENSRLKNLLEEKDKNLADAEIKISKLQATIASFEEKQKKVEEKLEVSEYPYHNGRRLCKSVNNIPSSIHLPVTYQRIVLESDI